MVYSPDYLSPDSNKGGGPFSDFLGYITSSKVLLTHFWMHTWVDLPVVLVYCAEALLFISDAQLVVNQRGGGEKEQPTLA